MKKKGSMWVSVVLYMALGVIVITIILSAGLPMVEKLKQKNTIAQTKTVFYQLDNNIRAVASEGPGSRRVLSPFEMQEGEFQIISKEDTRVLESLDFPKNSIGWKLKTTAKIMEPCPYETIKNGASCAEYMIQEGAIIMSMQETQIVDEYDMFLILNYNNALEINDISELQPPYKGIFSLTIEHTGKYPNNLPVINVKVA